MDDQKLSRRALLHTPAAAAAAGAVLVGAPAARALPVRDDTELSPSGLYDGGWTPIDSGSHTGGSFTIDLTDGGQFPAGTFSMIRLHFTGAMDAGGSDLLLRVNVDGSAGLHQFGLAVRDFHNWDSPPTSTRATRPYGGWRSGIPPSPLPR